MLKASMLFFGLPLSIDKLRKLNLLEKVLLIEKSPVEELQTSNWSLTAAKILSPIPETCLRSSIDLN